MMEGVAAAVETALTGQTVVYKAMVSVVTCPTGQLVMEDAHEVTV